MGGWKILRGVTLCKPACCYGYEERQLPLPLLQNPVTCTKLSDKELQLRKERIQKELAKKKVLPEVITVPSLPQELPKEALRYLREWGEITEDYMKDLPSEEVYPKDINYKFATMMDKGAEGGVIYGRRERDATYGGVGSKVSA